MKIQGHINVYGDIYPDQSQYASEWGIVSLKTVTDAINANASADELIVHIHSRGGDVNEGFAIHDALFNSGKKITTVIEGMCASIATVISLSGTTRKITENSEFMIHNPWGSISGTAEEIAKYAEQVAGYEDKILNFYVEKTGGDKKLIKSMMADETTMGSETALEMKFVTEIVDTVNAFALINTKQNKMSKEKSVLQKAIDALKGAVQALAPTALTLSTIDGKTLCIEQDGDVLVVNSPVKISDKDAPDGDYSLSTGNTITVKSGKISAIKATEPVAAVETTVVTPVVDAKDTEIAALKAENARLVAEQSASTQALTEATAILAKLKSVSSTVKPEERTAAANSATTSPVSGNRAAIDRAREAREAAAKKVTA